MSGVAVGDLSASELQQYIKVLQDEINLLMSHFNTLKTARERYLDSKVTLEHLEQCKEGDKTLIPLTKSLFVRGELGSTDTAIVEVGAGYYIKMSTTKGKDFMVRKMQNMTTTLGEIEKNVMIKRKQLEIMEMTLRQRMMQNAQPKA